MPRVMLALPQEAITVTRNVTREVVSQFLQQTGFPEIHEYFFQEYAGGAKQIKNLFNLAETNGVRTPYQNYAFIEATETFTEDGINTARWQNQYHSRTFWDQEHGVEMRPFYGNVIVELSIRLRSMDLTKLNSWILAMRTNHSMRAMTYNHRLPYEVDIPVPFLDFIHETYVMKTATEGATPEPLSAYLKRCFGKGVTKRQNLTQTESDIIVHEVQENVLGMVTDESFYNAKEINEGVYEITVPYRFEYQKPIAMSMVFPSTIRSQLIPERFINAWVAKAPNPNNPDLEIPSYTLDRMGAQKPPFYRGDGGTRLVEWDDWYPQNPPDNTETVFITPILVDPAEPTLCCDLDDLVGDYIPAAVVQYLKDFQSLQGEAYRSVVGIEIYRVDADGERLITHVLDTEGRVYTTQPMDITKRYYLRLSLMYDLALYNKLLTKQLLAKPELAMGLFRLYDASVELTDDAERVKKELPPYLKAGRYPRIPSLLFSPTGEYITGRSYTFWLKKLKSTNELFVNLQPKTDRSVGYFSIIARRRS